VCRKNIYKAVIVGLGQIAWSFDRASDPASGKHPLTHAGAYQAHPGVQLVGGYSPDPQDAVRFKKHFKAPTYHSLEDLLDACQPDIVSICSPPAFHAEQARDCIHRHIPMVWLEKPPTTTLAELDLLIDEQTASRVLTQFLVNFMRRYTPCYQNLRRVYEEKTFGEPIALDLTYSQGLERNGCHLLDVAFFLTADRWAPRLEPLTSQGDPENPSFVFRMGEDLPIFVRGLSLNYHCLDVVLACERGRVSVLHNGMTTRSEQRIEDPLYPGYFCLKNSEPCEIGPGGLDGCMTRALDDLIEAHETHKQPVSSLSSARRATALVEEVLQQVSALPQ